MSSAQDLFEQGVSAVRQKDRATGQKLLRKSLKADPNNDMAWVWLAKTISDKEKQIKMLERALEINPSNQQVVAILEKLGQRQQETLSGEPRQMPANNTDDSAKPAAASSYQPPAGVKTTSEKLSTEESIECVDLIQKGNAVLNHGDEEGAIGFWLQVLDIQIDHPGAFPLIFKKLEQLNFPDDAKEIAWRALNAGSPSENVADELLRLVHASKDADEIDATYQKMAAMPHVRSQLKLAMIAEYMRTKQPAQTFNLTKLAADAQPNNQTILWQLAQLYDIASKEDAAQKIYQRIADIDPQTEEGKLASKKLGKSGGLSKLFGGRKK